MKRKVMAVLTSLCVCMGLFCSSPAVAGLSETISIDKSENYYEYYKLSDGTFGIRKYLGEEEKLIIMNGFEGNKTTRLCAGMFADNTTTKSIKIPYCINYIEDGLLNGNCSIEEITINNEMSDIYKAYDGILYYGLDDNKHVRLCPRGKAGKVTIKEGFSVISGEAFTDCEKVTSVYIPVDVTAIKEKAFLGCSSLTDVYYAGPEEYWESIIIENDEDSNEALLNAKIHYLSDGSEGEEPEESSTPNPDNDADSPTEPTAAPNSNETPVPSGKDEADSTPNPAAKPTTVPASGPGITVNPTPVPTSIPIPHPIVTVTLAPTATPVPAKEPVMDNNVAKAQGKSLSYMVKTDASGNRTAMVSVVRNKNIKSVVIPTTITINGKKYTVTKIEPKAFSGCKKLKQVIIGAGVKSVGRQAFKKCKKLKKVVITSNKITTFGKSAFSQIAPKAKLYLPKKNYKTYKQLIIKSGAPKNVVYKRIIVIK